MIIKNITNFRKNIFEMLEQTVKYGEIININTRDSNAIVVNEEDYRDLIETVNIISDTKMKKKIIAGLNTPINECTNEEDIEC